MKKNFLLLFLLIIVPILFAIWIYGFSHLIANGDFSRWFGGNDKPPKTNYSDLSTGSSIIYSEEDSNIKIEAILGNDKLSTKDKEGYLLVALSGKDIKATHKRVPLNLSIVIDRSGSMRGEKLEYVKDAVKQAARKLNSDDSVTLVVYDDKVETLYSSQGRFDLARFNRIVDGIESGGSTYLEGGLREGILRVSNNEVEDKINRVILLSDGLANVGVSDSQKLANITEQLVGGDIVVSTIGVGADYDERLMTSIARAGSGNYYFLESPEQSNNIFVQEFSDAMQVVASDIEVEFGSSDFIEIVEGVGYDLSSKSKFYPHSLGANQQQIYLFKYQIKAGESLEPLQTNIVNLQVKYKDSLNVRRELDPVRVGAKVVSSSVNLLNDDRVYEEYIRSYQAEQLWQVYDELDKNKNDEAKKNLDSLLIELEDANTRLDGKLDEDITAVKDKQKYIDSLGSQHVNESATGRIFQKSNQNDSYQIMYNK